MFNFFLFEKKVFFYRPILNTNLNLIKISHKLIKKITLKLKMSSIDL